MNKREELKKTLKLKRNNSANINRGKIITASKKRKGNQGNGKATRRSIKRN